MVISSVMIHYWECVVVQCVISSVIMHYWECAVVQCVISSVLLGVCGGDQ